MSEIAPVSLASLAAPSGTAATPAVANQTDVARFERLLQATPEAETPQTYLRRPGAEESALSAQLVNYVDSFDQKFHTTFKESIESVGKMDMTDPMSMVHVLELQANIFSVSMELELATKLADSGRHFATTLFQNQG